VRPTILLALLTACADSTGGDDDTSLRDASSPRDAAPMDASASDATPGTDAETGLDATAGMDAMPGMDAMTGMDALPMVDAGIDPSMTFFATSAGTGPGGGNYGGLAGADARCQAFATSVGAGGRTWRAYLSTAGGGPTVNARDRIGSGPWFNARGEQIAADLDALHGNGIASNLILTELGTEVPSNEHDILTGSMEDGTAWTEFPGNPSAPPPNCFNWTSNDPGAYAYAGHSDWDMRSGAWNAAHETTCDEAGLMGNAGSGRIYCFAVD
jgi:hypothetical protein